ncbi:AI-2E family transporter [Tautonia plasticadhaerens]|uniref:AI-2 transport protein TqsA n=1 Tax=Tautonia plasticadhaerens TaxID=2527974 RepID=A0A518GXV0_9BACT|nr:AI-2E family transporter [Tautonia plasticadhaerens]QDV33405.1 AI-2 transport protein TqsA [Tautonia plasticadhaerens]
MAERYVRVRMNHPVIITMMILAIIAFMYFAAEVLRPLALALLLSLVLAPVVAWLERRGLPRVLAVVLTVLLTLGSLGGVGFVVIQQLGQLANDLTENRSEIERKISDVVDKGQPSTLGKLEDMAADVSRSIMEGGGEADEGEVEEVSLAESPEPPGVVGPTRSGPFAPTGPGDTESTVYQVEVVDRPTIQDRFSTAVGPLMEPAAIFSVVLVLTAFMLITRDDLFGRIIQVIGVGHISLTTRTFSEAAERISKYLTTFSSFNALCGVFLGTGLWLIGVPYAVLWGFLVFVLRFIPYVGPWTAFVLPLGYSIVFSEGWRDPILVAVLFITFEAFSEYVLEPILYGRTTGITAVGLLISAMFWTWLWGAPGLLLSTPLTVCLAVLGKYVPGLRFFATMLGEDVVLERNAQFYQRLLARDSDGALEVVEEALDEGLPIEQAFDDILIPALSRAEGDLARGVIEEGDQSFVWHVTRTILDELDTRSSEGPEAGKARPGSAGEFKVVGVASSDAADAMVLRMVALALRPSGVSIEIVTSSSTPLEASEQVAQGEAEIVLLSHLPPVGLTSARYLVKRLKALFPDVPIWAGRWGGSGGEKARTRLTGMGADRVVFSVAEVTSNLPEALKLAQGGKARPRKAGASR